MDADATPTKSATNTRISAIVVAEDDTAAETADMNVNVDKIRIMAI